MENDNQFITELREHIGEEQIRDASMADKIQNLEDKVDKLSEDVKTLLEMWQQAKGIITFVKWMAGISGGIVAFIVFIKDHIK